MEFKTNFQKTINSLALVPYFVIILDKFSPHDRIAITIGFYKFRFDFWIYYRKKRFLVCDECFAVNENDKKPCRYCGHENKENQND